MPSPRPFVSRHARLLSLLPCLLALAGCASDGSPETMPASSPANAWSASRQIVLVTSDGWDDTRGKLHRYERKDGGAWQVVGETVPVMLGRAGSAWGTGLHPAQANGLQKQEGDGRAPAGVFSIGTAFGYAMATTTRLPYRAMDADDWCIDVNASPLYNRIVSARDVGPQAIEGSTEPMRRDLHANGDVRYKLGFVIEHNPGNVSGGGSCIFAHLWREPGETTAGCTAMTEPAMQALLAWLDPEHAPVFALLPEAEYHRLAAAWHLPSPSND